MMKILYVEDELAKNIPRIIGLFKQYLSEGRIKKLQSLEEDTSGYGASPEEIKKIIEETQVIDVEYRFPEALKKVILYHQEYVRFIIDRNLSGTEYTVAEVQAIDQYYDEHQYSGREGDYLFLKIGLCGDPDILTRVYFLTAYPSQDELRCNQEIKSLRQYWRGAIRNFIEKGNHQDLKRLQNDVINLNLQNTIEGGHTSENSLC